MEDNELRSVQASGKSVDEAIFKGLQEMEISIDEVSIEIIQTETKGILGFGAKPAIVRLTQRPAEEYELPDYMKKANERFDRKLDRYNEKQNKRREKENRRAEKRAERPAGKEKDVEPAIEKEAAAEAVMPVEAPKAEAAVEAAVEAAIPDTMAEESVQRESRPRRERHEGFERRERAPRNNNINNNIENGADERETLINYTVEAAEGNPAAEFVKGLIERMGAEGTVLAAQDEDCLRLRIDSEMIGMLIGHRGETLDAMQYLTGLVINKNRKTEGYTRVTLNTEEYREKREETLKRLARKVASQVKATGRPRALEPMNPYERRVLHSALQNHPDVMTHSEGEEPNRRVVVTPRRRGGYGRNRNNRRRDNGYKKNAEAVETAEKSNDVEINVENIENSVENTME
ncbi:MAG: Jag N-terminal domain-containing protein [Clostridia bacterium]|nr:Jag N-terminal domain-containing protein [Clostridia bacterium]